MSNRITTPTVPNINRQAFDSAVSDLGISGFTPQKLGSALTLGKSVQTIGPQAVGIATVVEVIETTRREVSDIERLISSSTELEPETEADLIKLKFNHIRLRLEAGKALIAINGNSGDDNNDKPPINNTPKPGEVVGVFGN